MPNRKKGKKKAASKPKPSAVAVSLTPSTQSLDDVSHLLFGDFKEDQLPYDLPFVGPVSLVDQRHCDATDQQVKVVHGRGLVVTRDVSPGECLFVIPAIVSTSVDKARRRFLESSSTSTSTARHLEDIAETLLVEQIQWLSQNDHDGKDTSAFNQRIFNSFISQMSSDDVPQTEFDVVLAQTSSNSADQEDKMPLDKETILNIIRRNAFGPDYHNYDTIANWWLKNSTNTVSESAYKRILSVYPLAAMINHSCSPNAVRIFGTIPASVKTSEWSEREVMIVHACAAMKKGTEITWSYLPPTTDYKNRHEMLKTRYGFSCECTRCTSEEKTIDGVELFQKLSSAITHEDNNILPDTIHSLEQTITSKSIPSQVQRYLRISYAPIYMQYFNDALSNPSIKNNDESISNILKLATQLHFSFVSCNNASTEHISILHLCYELASLQHTRYLSSLERSNNDIGTETNDNNPTKTMSQVRFWTDQLKLAHMTRYGKLGERLECVREVMKRSRVVLRNRDGWYMVGGGFI